MKDLRLNTGDGYLRHTLQTQLAQYSQGRSATLQNITMSVKYFGKNQNPLFCSGINSIAYPKENISFTIPHDNISAHGISKNEIFTRGRSPTRQPHSDLDFQCSVLEQLQQLQAFGYLPPSKNFSSFFGPAYDCRHQV